jgi:3'-phosphoadenosine 5'-phosphosulfate sulfotransferase (PAPS reductase)/FAD synthetase
MENKLTLKEVEQRIHWTLSQKIDHSLYIIDSFIAQYPTCTVSFSGGVDSTVLLFLTRMINKDRKGIFVNTTNELSEILKFVKTVENIETILPEITFTQVVEKYGFPLISKKVSCMLNHLKHPTNNNAASRQLHLTGIKRDGTKSTAFLLAKKWKHIIAAPYDVTDKCCYYLKKKPLHRIEGGSLVGTMATDSMMRKMVYMQTGCINPKNTASNSFINLDKV